MLRGRFLYIGPYNTNFALLYSFLLISLDVRQSTRAHAHARTHTVSINMCEAAFTRAILRVGGPLHLTRDTQKAVGWRVS